MLSEVSLDVGNLLSLVALLEVLVNDGSEVSLEVGNLLPLVVLLEVLVNDGYHVAVNGMVLYHKARFL